MGTRLENVAIEVVSGTGYATQSADAHPLPLVRMTITATNLPEPIWAILPADTGLIIGRDITAASVISWAEAGIRISAKEQGFDADTVIGHMKALIDLALKNPVDNQPVDPI